jgi:hypothetical protein
MRLKKSIIFLLFIFFGPSEIKAQITNTIVVKVGEEIITIIDLQNEILTDLIINNQEITQKNIDNRKSYSIKKLINKKIKRIEINKYEITNYSESDLNKYISLISENLNTDLNGLKIIFKENNIDFNIFLNSYKTELLWNTLIFRIYKNQTNINIVEVENEIKKIKIDANTIEIEKLKTEITNKRKAEKLKLFSRSHMSNLENTTPINYNE